MRRIFSVRAISWRVYNPHCRQFSASSLTFEELWESGERKPGCLRIRAGTNRRQKWQDPPPGETLSRKGPKLTSTPSVPTPYGIHIPGVSFDSIQSIFGGRLDTVARTAPFKLEFGQTPKRGGRNRWPPEQRPCWSLLPAASAQRGNMCELKVELGWVSTISGGVGRDLKPGASLEFGWEIKGGGSFNNCEFRARGVSRARAGRIAGNERPDFRSDRAPHRHRLRKRAAATPPS